MTFARNSWVWLLAGMLVSGCGGRQTPAHPETSTRPDTRAASVESICPSSTVRDGVPHCTAVYAGDRPLRLPADPSENRRYGAVKRAGTGFHTAGGDVPLAEALRSKLGAVTREQHNGHPNTVYLATIDNGTVTAVQPVAVVPEDLLLTTVFAGRALEGTIGALTGPQTYSFTRTFPVRVEFGAAATGGRLAGRIVNATAAARGSDGGCLAALAGVDGAPLVGNYTADLQIERVPSMHAEFNDELVLWWKAGSNMGPQFFPSVATLLGGDPLEASWTATLHGVPTGGPELVLHTVPGGGGAC